MEKPDTSLICSKCQLEFNLSERLPMSMTTCEDIFCKNCLRNMLNDLKISEITLKCPKCTKLNKLDNNFKRNLNYFSEAKETLLRLKSIIEERIMPKCKTHPENNACLICLSCQNNPDEAFCQSCINAKHSNCPKALIQSKKEFELLLKKAYVPITSLDIKSQLMSLVDQYLKDIRDNFESLLVDSLISFDQDFVKNRPMGIPEYFAKKNDFVLATNKKEIKVINYLDPFLNEFLEKLETTSKQSETRFAALNKNMRSHIVGYTWLDYALNENFQVENLRHLLTESEKYPKIEELISLEKLNSLRLKFSLMEKQKLKELTLNKGDSQSEPGKYNEVIEQYLLKPKDKTEVDKTTKSEIMMRETLRNPLNLDPISARITQGLNDRLKMTIEQGEALSAKAAENFECDPSKSVPLLTVGRFVVIENWILSRKITPVFEGNKVYFTRKSNSKSQTLHCLVNMNKISQESLFRLRLVHYDNSCCSHFGFCDVKEIECIKNNKMRFSSKHARCYITNGYAPCILESQQYLGVKWCEEDKNFQEGDVIYIHVVPQRVIHFYLQRQNLTISFEKFDGHCDPRFFMTFVNKTNEYEFEQLL